MSRRGLLPALALLLALGTPAAHAASGYDLADMWIAPGKPGWAVEFVQQRDTIFATLYVYDAGRQPTWYSATLAFLGLTPQTHAINYAGDLYRTTGPWFGDPAGFDPLAVAYVRVGTMKVVASSMSSAVLEYEVDGLRISTPIERFTFRFEDYSGSYAGVQRIAYSKCSNPADDGTVTAGVAMTIVQSGTAMTLTATSPAGTCTYTGTYGQDGRLGRFTSTYTCSTGVSGAAGFSEMNVQRFGLLATMFGADSRGCHLDGSVAGVGP